MDMMTDGQTLAEEEEDDIAVDAGLAPTPAQPDAAVFERVKTFCQKRAVVVRCFAAFHCWTVHSYCACVC